MTVMSATDARSALDARMADSAWADRYLNGDADARKEFSDLTRAVTTGSGAMANSDAWAKGGADYLASRGITSGEIQDTLSGKPPTSEEYQAAVTGKRQALASKDFQQRYGDSEPEALRQMTKHNDIITRWESASRVPKV
ncbi:MULTISPECIES: hypothetical protein [unclassified Bradyrhizobium]|uniref:hypothetical protein n=1 Tax=unclassified Bradyrhizobium TaxID=2631580 RepID=UPI001FF84173|nr:MULTISPECIES: hypothetical protein [unclassified Bradyrhizobium]MCK1707626.1 hypothetical protein [Bradyrhizobium sp. 143]MCK1724837.1 hypothetical protein [Bradyrhizobium sp. 142]